MFFLQEKKNKLKELEHALEREERRILVELTRRVAVHVEEIEASLAVTETLDLMVARHRLGKQLRGVLPEVGRGVMAEYGAESAQASSATAIRSFAAWASADLTS